MHLSKIIELVQLKWMYFLCVNYSSIKDNCVKKTVAQVQPLEISMKLVCILWLEYGEFFFFLL